MSVVRDEDPELGFVHRFVPGTAPGGVTLLLLHGTGGDENDLLPLGRQLLPGAALLSPRGKVLEAGMPRWFRRLAPGVFDEEDVRFRARELAAFIRAAAGRYGVDTSRLAAVGYSNGANIASAVLLLEPGLLRAAVLLRPMVPFEPEALPDLRGTGVLIAAAVHDPMAPPAHAQRLARMLEDAGAEVELVWAEGGHQLTAHDLAAARSWLRRRFGVG